MIPSYAFQDQGEAASLVIPWNEAHDSLGYVPASNCDANHCEMWVRAITGETFAHSGAYNDTLRFSFVVDRESLVERQGGQVLTLGAYVHEPAGDSLVKAVAERFCFASRSPSRSRCRSARSASSPFSSTSNGPASASTGCG